MGGAFRMGALFVGLGIGFGLMATIGACTAPKRAEAPASDGAGAPPGSAAVVPSVSPVDPDDTSAFDELLSSLAGKRVVFIGETHDRYDHHLNQLAVIRGLHERGVDLAVGMEFFQEPFQPALDRYLAGEIDEKALLRQTEYYDRWRYDYRLYRDILAFARANPLVALNAPAELVAQVSKNGLDGLAPEDRARLPHDMTRAEPTYEARLRPIYEMHGKASAEGFHRFVDVQRVWDEHMARVARDYLNANASKTLVVLAGSGHVVYPDAIPGRLARMASGGHAVIATDSGGRHAGARVDFLLAERDIELPPPGRMGMMLAGDGDGVAIREVSPAGPAASAGFRSGDRILSIAGEPIGGMEDVRLALLDRAPGDRVWVEVGRGRVSAGDYRQGRSLTLL